MSNSPPLPPGEKGQKLACGPPLRRVLPEHFARAAASGITGIITMPWMFYSGPDEPLDDNVDGMRRFRKALGLSITPL